mmetsp:Transcript_90864/g.253843  ORF Transcript_90864/g.253843 Transcript_90864/m.253843 type:complete len:204 (+) Transcript_90864:187-798(+)
MNLINWCSSDGPGHKRNNNNMENTATRMPYTGNAAKMKITKKTGSFKLPNIDLSWGRKWWRTKARNALKPQQHPGGLFACWFWLCKKIASSNLLSTSVSSSAQKLLIPALIPERMQGHISGSETAPSLMTSFNVFMMLWRKPPVFWSNFILAFSLRMTIWLVFGKYLALISPATAAATSAAFWWVRREPSGGRRSARAAPCSS